MKKVVLAAALAAVVCVSASAVDPFTGEALHNSWIQYKTAQARSGAPVNDFMVGLYVAFVVGVLRGTNLVPGTNPFAIPDAVRIEQLCAIVGNYLDAHPEEWSEDRSGEYIVGEAILEVYPNKSAKP